MPGWRDQAACRNLTDDSIFFPPENPGGKGNAKGTDPFLTGKMFCRNLCPVRWDCLFENLNEPYGVFGGTEPTQRRRILMSVRIRTRGTVRGFTERYLDTGPKVS